MSNLEVSRDSEDLTRILIAAALFAAWWKAFTVMVDNQYGDTTRIFAFFILGGLFASFERLVFREDELTQLTGEEISRLISYYAEDQNWSEAIDWLYLLEEKYEIGSPVRKAVAEKISDYKNFEADSLFEPSKTIQ